MRHLTGKVVLVVLAMSLALMPLASQTSPEQKPSFEPVTIKRAAYGQSAKKLIGYGYQVHDFQIVGGPDWAGTDLWDIQSDSGGQKLGHFVGVNGTTDVVGLWNSARQCMPATKAKLG